MMTANNEGNRHMKPPVLTIQQTMKSVLTLFTALLLAPSAGQTAETPLGDAAAVWHFGGAEDSQQRHPLIVRGVVQLGVGLAGDERAASLARGRWQGGAVRRRPSGNRRAGV